MQRYAIKARFQEHLAQCDVKKQNQALFMVELLSFGTWKVKEELVYITLTASEL